MPVIPAGVPPQRKIGILPGKAKECTFAASTSLRSQYIPQVNISGRYAFGTQINCVPPKGEVPVSAKGTQGNLVVTLRPTSRLRNDNTYILSRLKSIRGRESIFTNHIIHVR